MSNVRVLVGTRKGAFILTSDGKREKCFMIPAVKDRMRFLVGTGQGGGLLNRRNNRMQHGYSLYSQPAHRCLRCVLHRIGVSVRG